MIAWFWGQRPRFTALLGTFAALIVLLSAWWQGHRWYRAALVSEYRAHVAAELALRSNALSLAASERLAVLQGLGAFAQLEADSPRFGDRFQEFARRMRTTVGDKGVRSVAAAPNGIVQYVYPPEANRPAVGYAPLDDPRSAVRADAQRAIESKEVVVVSTPGELAQSGIDLSAWQALHLPVTKAQEDGYWGLVNVVFDLPSLLAEAALESQQDELAFALRDGSGSVLYGRADVFALDPVIAPVSLPTRDWELAAAPLEGWDAAVGQPLIGFSGSTLLIALLLVALTYTNCLLKDRVW
jgi:sensor domain CHASE-containing protein